MVVPAPLMLPEVKVIALLTALEAPRVSEALPEMVRLLVTMLGPPRVTDPPLMLALPKELLPLMVVVPPDRLRLSAVTLVAAIRPPSELDRPPETTRALLSVTEPAPDLAKVSAVSVPLVKVTMPLALLTATDPARMPAASSPMVEAGVPSVTLSPE